MVQKFRGTLTGTVTNPSGATIGQAQVQAVNRATQQTYSVTNNKGDYFIPYILPGTYTLTVTAPRFEQQVQQNVVVQGNRSSGINFALQLEAVGQTVEVSDAPLCQISQVHQPRIVNVDFGLHKNFATMESKRLQVRGKR